MSQGKVFLLFSDTPLSSSPQFRGFDVSQLFLKTDQTTCNNTAKRLFPDKADTLGRVEQMVEGLIKDHKTAVLPKDKAFGKSGLSFKNRIRK
jgi:hypothetical protein